MTHCAPPTYNNVLIEDLLKWTLPFEIRKAAVSFQGTEVQFLSKIFRNHKRRLIFWKFFDLQNLNSQVSQDLEIHFLLHFRIRIRTIT
jgi:hypothetical protein